MSLKYDLQYAIEVARGAGKIVSDQYGKVSRLTKRQAEAVTDADRASQRYIVQALRSRSRGTGSSVRRTRPATRSLSSLPTARAGYG